MGARILVVDDSPTIRKLVCSILERHSYEATTAPDGFAGLARLREGAVDLVLLDFVMPRMNGYQFCREMRADAALNHLPVVLMSAKSDKIRGQFVEQTGAIDAISKPFDARGLLAAIENALQRSAEGRLRLLEPSPIEEDISLTDIEDSGTMKSATSERDPKDASSELARALGAKIAAELSALPDGRRGDRDEIIESLRRALSKGGLEDVTRLVAGSDSTEGFGGQIQVIPLAEVLQVLQLQRQSGTCLITGGKVAVTIFFRDGLIDLARGRGAADEFRLGRYLVEEGLVTREELNLILRKRDGATKKLLGESLVGFGLISEEDLRRALIRQTSELIYEVLRWPKGRFAFHRAGAEGSGATRLGLPVASIVMEGFRRVDEWRLIEESIHFDEVLLRDPVALDALGQEKLTRVEQLVLDAIDGRRTVREIIATVEVGSFDACKILYQFLQSRLVRRRAA